MTAKEKKELFVQAWKSVFGVETVNDDDNFFEVGGDSIKGVQLVGWLIQKGLKLDMLKIYTAPTVAELVEELEETQPMAVPAELLTKDNMDRFMKDPAVQQAMANMGMIPPAQGNPPPQAGYAPQMGYAPPVQLCTPPVGYAMPPQLCTRAALHAAGGLRAAAALHTAGELHDAAAALHAAGGLCAAAALHTADGLRDAAAALHAAGGLRDAGTALHAAGAGRRTAPLHGFPDQRAGCKSRRHPGSEAQIRRRHQVA